MLYQRGHKFLEKGQREPSFLGVGAAWALFIEEEAAWVFISHSGERQQ